MRFKLNFGDFLLIISHRPTAGCHFSLGQSGQSNNAKSDKTRRQIQIDNLGDKTNLKTNLSTSSLQIHRSVALGKGVDMAAELCEFHTEKAIGDIDKLGDGDAKEAIFKILNNLR